MSRHIPAKRSFGNAEDIISVTARPQLDWIKRTVNAAQGHHETVRGHLFQAAATTPILDLGSLAVLPVEVLTMISLELDVQSAFRFSHTCRGTRGLLSHTRSIRQLGEHALECIWALLRTRTADGITLDDLFSTMTQYTCGLCGQYGGFLSLLTLKRCCHRCALSAEEMGIVSVYEVTKRAYLSTSTVKRFGPTMITHVPVRTFGRRKRRGNQYGRKFLTLLASCKSLLDQYPERVKSIDVLQELRLNAVTSLPYLNTSTGRAEVGVFCKSCKLSVMKRVHYSHDGFLDHFRQCAKAQELWVSRRQGKTSMRDRSDGEGARHTRN